MRCRQAWQLLAGASWQQTLPSLSRMRYLAHHWLASGCVGHALRFVQADCRASWRRALGLLGMLQTSSERFPPRALRQPACSAQLAYWPLLAYWSRLCSHCVAVLHLQIAPCHA